MNAIRAIDPHRPLRDFLRERWERLPGTVPGGNPYDDDATLLFDALRSAGRRFVAGDPSVEFVLWLDGRKVAMPQEFAPAAEDADLQAYLQRLIRRHPNVDFTVLLANPHLYSPSLWARARAWVREVANEVGMPNGGADTCTFLGHYRRTPFGVHRGQMSVLTMPAIGSKRFVLWPFAYGDRHLDLQDSLEFSAHMAAATVEEAAHGDLLYWPADFWHVADAPRKPTAAWNIGFWWDRPPLSRVLGAITETASAAGHALSNAPSSFVWREDAGERELHTARDALRALARSGDLDDALAVQWARFASADGFRQSPPARPERRAPRGKLRAEGRIVLRALRRRRLCLAANGHVALLDRCPTALQAWLQALAAGETLSPPRGADAGDVLDFLAAAGALSAADDAGEPR